MGKPTRHAKPLVVAVAAVAAMLVACKSGTGHDPSGESLPSLASSLGCAFTEIPGEHELYTSDEGTCGGLTLYGFKGTGQRDSWLAAAEKVGGNYLVGPSWVVSADSPASVKSAQDKVGGQVR